jgi:FixJ family two-component response regulator
MMSYMSGPDLALQLKEFPPDMRVMLMSGYPDGRCSCSTTGRHFIEKPFVPAQLVAKINEVLSEEIRDQGTDHFDTPKKLHLAVSRT